jgi:probable HAF family extracellular repeat protein
MMWTEQTGIQLLADVEGEALGVSGDGSTVVGAASGRAFRWTKQDGLQLMDLGYAFAASFDGSVIVGRRWDGQVLRWQAFRWSEETGTMPVGDLPGGSVLSAAHDVSADGSVVVGWSAAKNDETAFVWDEVHGMRDLHNVLIEQGVNLAGWHLSSVEAVSGDGLTLVGYGTNPAGNYEPWIAVVPEPGSRSLILPGMLVVIGGLRHWPRRRLCLR